MHVIGMRVGVGHGIQRANFSIQELIAQIRRGIDKHARRALFANALDQHRTTATCVFGIGGIAIAPMSAKARHTTRRAATKDRKA